MCVRVYTGRYVCRDTHIYRYIMSRRKKNDALKSNSGLKSLCNVSSDLMINYNFLLDRSECLAALFSTPPSIAWPSVAVASRLDCVVKGTTVCDLRLRDSESFSANCGIPTQPDPCVHLTTVDCCGSLALDPALLVIMGCIIRGEPFSSFGTVLGSSLFEV